MKPCSCGTAIGDWRCWENHVPKTPEEKAEFERLKLEYHEAYVRNVLEPSIDRHIESLRQQGITHFHVIHASSEVEADKLIAELNRTCEMCNP